MKNRNLCDFMQNILFLRIYVTKLAVKFKNNSYNNISIYVFKYMYMKI